MKLTSLLFKNNARLEAAADNAPPLRYGETGHPIMLFQAGLLQLGYKMPITTRKQKGVPDGIYGDETFATVKKFQSDRTLTIDGIAGKETIRRLDSLLPKGKPMPPKPPLPGPKPPVPKKPPAPSPPGPTPKIPESDQFKIGTDDPPIKPDPGAGVWDSEPTSPQSIAIKVGVLTTPAFLAACAVAIGDDATKHLYHYFLNTGSAYTIDLEDMIESTPRATKVFKGEIRAMADYVEQLPPGAYSITSKHITQSRETYNYQGETRNWFFAIGGYSVWGKGRATVDAAGNYQLEYEYRFFDRYNWDGGKSVTIQGITITDEWMGQFHREGVAHEFNCVGSVRRSLRWSRATPLDLNAIKP